MLVGIAPRPRIGELALDGRQRRTRRPRGDAAGARNRLRRTRHLRLQRCEAGLRGGEIAVDLRHLRARRADPVGDRTGPGQRAEVARLEIGPLGIRVRQPLLQLRQLRIEEVEALRRLAAIAAQVGFDEDVDQLLGNLLRQLGAGRGGGNLEQIVLLAFHLDRLREARDAIGDVAVARHGLRKVGAAHHLFQVHRADQCLADRVDVLLLRLGGGIHRRRQDRLHLHEHARPRFVAARDLAHHEPAEHAHAPGDRQRQPAPGPDRMEREARFVVEAVHPIRTSIRG